MSAGLGAGLASSSLFSTATASCPLAGSSTMVVFSGTVPPGATWNLTVNGVAIGSGMDIALACDVVLASEHARFGQLYVKVGLMSDTLGLWLLPQLVGRSRASEMLMTGEIIDAAEAGRIGLVSRVVAADDLLPTAYDIAGRIAANPPQSIARIKQGLRLAAGREQSELAEVAKFVGHGLAHLFTTEDHKEATAAFAEKRTPKFTGR